MGESLYRQGEYDLAILDYQKVISNHPKDSHTPAALLKQGMSFEKLTDNETAKIIYRKLIKDHPGTPEAEKARARQADL
jgi:TolA-binding protein